jgi:uncharacterized membrane protein/YHS domain-containing protein
MLRSVLLVGAVCAILFAPARGQEPAESEINKMCPVMPEEEVDPEITLEYEGKTVAFCCDMCWKKFKADPERYLSRLPQFASLTAESADDASSERPSDGSDADESAHDHASTTPEEREPFLGRLHPVIVHFPLAGIPVALLGFLIWLRTGRESFARADVPALFMATIAAGGAWYTGGIAHESMRFSKSMEVIAGRHDTVSTIILVVVLCLSALRIWRWNRMTGAWRWIYGGGLAVAAVLLGITGFLGGSLVFGPGHLGF